MILEQEVRRAELGHFLRERRGRIDPSDVGIVEQSRRRKPGLRRAEVAVLAGLSTSWYTFLEQGRDIQPSRSVLDSLACVLRMSEDERRYIHHLVYGMVDERPPVDTAQSDVLLTQLVALFETSPYPVYGCNAQWDVVAWNAANAEWYCEWGALADGERNILRWLMCAPQARERLVDWADVAQDTVARWRATCGKYPDKAGAALTEELIERSPEFGRWWNEQTVAASRATTRRFRVPHSAEVRELQMVPLLSPELGRGGVAVHLPTES